MKRFFLILLIALPCFVPAQNIDIDILKTINPDNPDALYWKITSSSGYWIPAAAVAGSLTYGFLHKDKSIQYNGYKVLISIGIGSLISEALKRSVNRTRPGDKYPDEIFVIRAKHNRSFPSGHTSLAFATAASLSLQYKKWYIIIPAYAWACTVGYSRMYLGLHYPSDVLAGAIIGMGSGYLSHWLTKKMFHKQSHP